MKYIYILTISLLFPVFTYGNSQIDIETSSINLEVGEEFIISVFLTDLDIDLDNLQIALPGVENFDVFAQSISSQFQSVNGDTQSITRLDMQVSAVREWVFEIGPVELQWDETLIDNKSIDITVRSQIQTTPALPSLTDEDEETQAEQNLTKNILNWWNNQDLWWLRELKLSAWTHGAFLIAFLGAFYLLLSYVLKTDTPKIESEITEKIENKNDIYASYFKKLSQEIGSLKSEDFFHQYNIWMRKIFWDMWFSNYHSATLSEFKKHNMISNDTRFPIFKKSYKHEYSGAHISIETQKKYIDEILNCLV